MVYSLPRTNARDRDRERERERTRDGGSELETPTTTQLTETHVCKRENLKVNWKLTQKNLSKLSIIKEEAEAEGREAANEKEAAAAEKKQKKT